MPQLRIALDPALLRDTRALAQSAGTTVHALVRDLLTQHLQQVSDPLLALRQPERASGSRIGAHSALRRHTAPAGLARLLSTVA